MSIFSSFVKAARDPKNRELGRKCANYRFESKRFSKEAKKLAKASTKAYDNALKNSKKCAKTDLKLNRRVSTFFK